jgi:4-hydroxyacetophenone monooxygenase
VVAITPWRNDDFWRMTRQANADDYIFTTPDAVREGRVSASG